jgi:hypothetical protein
MPQDDSPPVPATSEQLIEQMKEFDAAIESNKQLETHMKLMIGRNLKLIKKKKKGAAFISFVQNHVTTYSQSMIYFLIEFHDLALEYNRLKYVTIGTGKLKTRFKLVKELVEAEPDYWKHTDA